MGRKFSSLVLGFWSKICLKENARTSAMITRSSETRERDLPNANKRKSVFTAWGNLFGDSSFYLTWTSVMMFIIDFLDFVHRPSF
jgi:hypothetical protein